MIPMTAHPARITTHRLIRRHSKHRKMRSPNRLFQQPVSLVVLDRTAKTLDVRGYCNYADRGGDRVFEEFSTPGPVALGGAVKYAGKWVGGTGKFSGLSGDFDISTSGNVAPEGLFQA